MDPVTERRRPGGADAPALSSQQLGELLPLLAGADSVELKLTVSDEHYRSTAVALGMDVLDAQIRQVCFFDTPDLDLDAHGVVVRARRVQGKARHRVFDPARAGPCGELDQAFRRVGLPDRTGYELAEQVGVDGDQRFLREHVLRDRALGLHRRQGDELAQGGGQRTPFRHVVRCVDARFRRGGTDVGDEPAEQRLAANAGGLPIASATGCTPAPCRTAATRARRGPRVGFSGWCYFTVNSKAPRPPVVVPDKQGPYSACIDPTPCLSGGGPGVRGAFTFQPDSADHDITGYRWSLTGAGRPHDVSGSTVTVPDVTPSLAGIVVLSVEAKDLPDRYSPPRLFVFKVAEHGRAGRALAVR